MIDNNVQKIKIEFEDQIKYNLLMHKADHQNWSFVANPIKRKWEEREKKEVEKVPELSKGNNYTPIS